MKRFFECLVLVVLVAGNLSCTEQGLLEKLQAIDHDLAENPGGALDSLLAIDNSSISRGDLSAYYSLLLTIAQHKNYLPFPNDSAISFARDYFIDHTRDYYNQARASFYYGVVRQYKSYGDTLAHRLMHQARQIMDDHNIQDDKLFALMNAYLGRINYGNANYEEAACYFRSAVESEQRLGNARNTALDLCDLLVCQVTLLDSLQAERTLYKLDSILTQHLDIQLENFNNGKALYYLYISHQLDSAQYYCNKWKPSPGDSGAKQRLLSTIYERRGIIDTAIEYEKRAYSNRRIADSTYYHTYYNRLSILYDRLGNRDSSAHYARRAYQSLRNNYSQKTEKRILELEKQYNLSTKDAELIKAKHHRALLMILLWFSLIIIAILIWVLRLNRKLKETEKQAKMKDTLTRSLLMSVLSTYTGINRKLSLIHNQPSGKRQDALNQLIRDNQKALAHNVNVSLEAFSEYIPQQVRNIADTLNGAQQRGILILTEMGYSSNEIAQMLSTSIDQVRSVKSSVRRQIEIMSPDLKMDASKLVIMQKSPTKQMG